MRPPWSHALRSHSKHRTGMAPASSLSRKGHSHECVCRHLRLWHTGASQKSHMAPTKSRPTAEVPDLCRTMHSPVCDTHFVRPHCPHFGSR